MVGAITNRDILAHPAVTIQSFGWRVFFKALFSGPEDSFLSLLRKTNIFCKDTSEMPELLAKSIELELQAKRIYRALAKAFEPIRAASRFFDDLARQEQEHVDMLELCRAAALRGGWQMSYLNPWQDYLPRLERQMQEAEAAMYSITSLDDALRLVVQLESSEINQVFQAILAASNSVFVKKMLKLQKAIENHISYIVQMLPELSPQLIQVSQELRAKFLRVA